MHPSRSGSLVAILVAALMLVLVPADAHADPHHHHQHQPPQAPAVERGQALGPAAVHATALIISNHPCGTPGEQGPALAAASDPGTGGQGCAKGCCHSGGHGCCILALHWSLVMEPPVAQAVMAAEADERDGVMPAAPPEPPRPIA